MFSCCWITFGIGKSLFILGKIGSQSSQKLERLFFLIAHLNNLGFNCYLFNNYIVNIIQQPFHVLLSMISEWQSWKIRLTLASDPILQSCKHVWLYILQVTWISICAVSDSRLFFSDNEQQWPRKIYMLLQYHKPLPFY